MTKQFSVMDMLGRVTSGEADVHDTRRAAQAGLDRIMIIEALDAQHVEERDTALATVETLRQRNSGLLGERDRAVKTAEDLRQVIELERRTRQHIPVVGITCDVAGCAEAVAIVGVKLVDVDAVSRTIVAFADKIGWTKHKHPDGDPRDDRWACYQCSKEGKKPS